MLSVLLAAFVPLVIPLAPGSPSDLVAVAAASGRPPECMPASAAKDGGDQPASIWRLARHPNLRRYCQLVARAHARLASDPVGARAAAEEAERLLPGRAAPQVVLARVALGAGKTADALAAFERALAVDPRAADHPLAMHDLALARRDAGKLEEALTVYRVLVPRASLLPSREKRARVLLEAAHVTMAAGAKRGGGGRHLDEALAYLREAARDPHHQLRLDIALSLVLALDRAGHPAQADAMLAEQRGLRAFVEAQKSLDYLAESADREALLALALERQDPAKAAEHWRAFAAAASGPFRAAAEARLRRLDAAPGKKKGRRR